MPHWPFVYDGAFAKIYQLKIAPGTHKIPKNTELYALLQCSLMWGFFAALLGLGMHDDGRGAGINDIGVDDHLFHILHAGKFIHQIKQDAFQDGAKAARAGFALDRLAGDGFERVIGEFQARAFHLEQFGILLDQRIFRLGQNRNQRHFVEIGERCNDGQTADEFASAHH